VLGCSWLSLQFSGGMLNVETKVGTWNDQCGLSINFNVELKVECDIVGVEFVGVSFFGEEELEWLTN
jgi:hypothetical protein